MIPYGRQSIDDADAAAVMEVLRSDWLTTGPKVAEFEAAFAAATGSGHAVTFANGTAALHAAMHAHGVGAGDEVIVAANTFVASANCVLYQGGRPVFADVDEVAMLIDSADVRRRITPRTRGIIAVDYAGQPCDYDALNAIAAEHGLFLHADACHALGAEFRGRKVGSLAGSSSF
ncbi:MAG: DegT/DnrJ/EryC1/StrS family aminotransferase, partial [Chthoniobacterales bacterium]